MSKRNQIAMSAQGRRSALMLSAAAIAVIGLGAGAAAAQVEPAPGTLPTGGSFTHGTGSIGSVGTDMTVTQTTDRGVVDWDSFDIASDASVHFDQLSATSVTVNRVDAGGGLSDIYGAMTSDGIVVILNPNGVIFGGSANVNVGGLVATTGDIDVASFMDGDPLSFTNAVGGYIRTHIGADISISNAGLAAFVAPHVRNDGTITAVGGSVSLAAGETFTLDLAGDGLLELGLPTNSPLVENYGSILAQGGRIQLSAAAASAVVGNVINTSGVLQVGGAHEADGVIVLEAAGGDIEVAGNIHGGDITISGDRIHGIGEINTGGQLTLDLNTGGIADTTTEGDNWIGDALGLIGFAHGGATVNVGAGRYSGFSTTVTGATNLTVQGAEGAVIDTVAFWPSSTMVEIGTNGTTISGFTINGDGSGVGISAYGRNITISGNTINNVETGIRTELSHFAEATTISNNTITANHGLALLAANHVVSGNTVNAAIEGVGLLQGDASFSDNTFTIGEGGEALTLYGAASDVQLDAADNIVSISGGGLQGAVDLAGVQGVVTAGAGVYDETVTIRNALTLTGAGMDATSITGGMVLTGVIDHLNLSGFTVTGTGAGNAVIRGSGASVTDLTMDDVRVDAESVSGRSGISGGHYGGDISITNSELVNIDHWVVFDTRSGSGAPGSGTNVSSFVFSDNLVDNVKGGITVRQNDGGTGSVLISGNTVSNIGDSTWSSGGLFKIFNAGVVDFTGNDISDVGTNASLTSDGTAYGAALLMRGVETLNVAGNTFTNVHMAVATEKNGFSAPTLTTFTNNTFTNTGYAFFMPTDAVAGGSVVFGAGNAINSGADTIQHIVWRGGSLLDLTAVEFNGLLGSEMTEAALLDLEDMITHATDVAGAGLALVNADNVYVTQNSGSIQRGVDAAGAGFTVNVGDGTYLENVLINTADLTLRSVNRHGAIIDAGGSGYGIEISSVHGDLGTIEIDGFTVQNWNTGGIVQSMAAGEFATTRVMNNNVIGPVGGSTAHGNGIQVSGDGSLVFANTVSGAVLNSADWSGSGILVVNASNVLVAGNTVSGSDIGIGVVNWNVGDVANVFVDNNTVSGASEGISIQAYGGTVSGLSLYENTVTGSDSGLGIWDWGSGAHSWADTIADIHGNTFADNQTHISSDFADAGVVGLLANNDFDRTIHAIDGAAIWGDLSFAVSDATAGSDLILSGDTFVEDDQILIDRDLTLTGVEGAVVQAGADFSGNSTAGAWWLVEQGVTFELSDLVLDGGSDEGFDVYYGLRNHGHTTIDNVAFRDIAHGDYFGMAVASFGGAVAGGAGAGDWVDSTLTITNSAFDNIGRIGVLVKGDGATAAIEGSTFTGRGAGGHVEYAIEVGASGAIEVTANTIANYRGVAASDGSNSAGILVTSYYGGASYAHIAGNVINGNTSAVSVGFAGSDVSVVEAFDNDLSGNDFGVTLNSAASTDFSGNWWGTADDAAILAYMGGDGGGSVDFSTYLTSGADTDAADGFQGDFSDIAVTALGGQTGAGDRIQEGVDFAADGGTVNVGAGTFVLSSTLNIGDSLSLVGAGRDETVIDGSGLSSYGMLVKADDVSLSGFTFQGNNSTSSSHYGIKVQPDSGDASDRVRNFAITDVTIQGWGGTELDLNGVVGAVIDGVIADGQDTKGVGIALTDSANVTIVNSATLNNLWGSVALYQTNRFYDQQLTDIYIDAGANSFGEFLGVFTQSYSDIGLDIGDLHLTGFSHVVVNSDHRANGDEFVFFRTSQQDALDFAVNLNPAESDSSVVGGWTGSDFDGTFTVGIGNLLGGGTQALSIAAAVDAAETGNIVRVLDGTYVLNSTLSIDEGIYLIGNGQGNTFIDASGVSGYGIHVTADRVFLNAFTLDGPAADAGSSYGIKVNPGSSDRDAVVDVFWITDVTVRGSGRTELDLHAVTNATIDGFTADGQGTAGVGIGITDSANIHIVNSTTLDNAWGGVGLWQRNASYDQQLTDIVIDGSNSFGEANGVYAQRYHTATREIGDLWIENFDFLVFNDQHDAGSDYYWFQRTQDDAINLAVNVNNADASVVGGWDGGDFDGTFVVGVGELNGGGTYAMSIGAAANMAEDGAIVRVLAGTYDGFGTALGGAEGVSFLGDAGATIDGSGVTGRIVDLRADGAVFSGFTIVGDGNGVGVSVSGRGVTVSGNTISNVLTGVQTTTQYAAGDAIISGNDITADYGVSLQNTGNTVTDNIVTASVEGVGLLQGANSFSDNAFAIGAGGDAMNLYGTASADDLLAAENVVTIAGGGLQGAVHLAGLDGVVNAGAGSYGESVEVGQRMTLNFSDVGVSVDGLTLTAGAAGSGVGGRLTADGDIVFAGDVVLLANTTLIGDTVTLAGVEGSTANGQSLILEGDAISLGSAGVTTALRNLMMFGDATLTGDEYNAFGFMVSGATTLSRDTALAVSGPLILGAVDGAHRLSIEAGGPATLGVVGANQALTSLAVVASGITSAGATTTGDQLFDGLTVSLEGDFATGGGDLTVTGPVTLADDVNATTGGGDASFGAIDGAWELDIDAGPGTITVAALGGGTALSGVSLTGGAIHTAGATTAGDQSYEGVSLTLSGDYVTGGGDFSADAASTLAGATSVVTGGGDLALGSVNGGHALTLNAGGGDAVLGSMGATTRLGAINVTASSTVLEGNVYAGSSLAFLAADADSTIRLTRTLTTFNSTVSAAEAGSITIAPHLIGTTNGLQSVVFIAGSGLGLASANGDISIGDAGSDALRLGAMTVTGNDFSAQTVKLAGSYTATLTGDQTFSANTLDTLGNVNATVGGNESGPIVAGGSVNLTVGGTSTGSLQAGGSTTVTSGGTQDRIIDATGPVNLSSGGGIGGSVTTTGSVNLQSTQNVDVQVNAGTVTVDAPGGAVTGNFGEITTDSGGTFVINGETVVGSGDADARQFLTDQFVVPAGGLVGSTGQIQLPVGLAIALIAPAGEGQGQRRPVVVNSIDRLGELLRLGYTAIIVQIDDGSEPAYEQELDIALEGELEPVA